MKIIEVKNATFAYKEKNVFEDINFHLNPGEILCLIGPNGCGKTTLLDCILGINTLKQGEVMLKGQSIKSLKPHQVAKHISYVPQSQSMTFPYRVMEIVLMGRAAYTSLFSSPRKKDIEIAEQALKTVGMSNFKERIYTQLSGGEAQMIMIARALAQQSPVMIMDEPTSHLDFKHEHTILETIVDLMREKKLAIIMATHFPNHAFYFENSGIKTFVSMLHEGRFKAVGSPSEVLSKENMHKIFNMDVKILSYEDDSYEESKFIVPLSTRRKVKKWEEYKIEEIS